MKFVTAPLLKFGLNCWPPFWGTGIVVRSISRDFRYAKVDMKLRRYNKNYFGVHFGGSLFAMTDPMYVLLLVKCLGADYYVWDKGAHIDYVKPARGKVTAEFNITDALIEQIKENTEKGEKYLPNLPILIKDEADDTVAELQRTIYIRKKQRVRAHV